MANPFEHDRVASEKIFTGREEEIRQIQSGLARTLANTPHHLVLYGDRGLGKTSLLYHIREESKKQGILFVHCNIGECQDMPQLTAAFLENFAEALKKQRDPSVFRALFDGVKKAFSRIKGVKIGAGGFEVTFDDINSEQKQVKGQLSTIISDLWAEIANEFSALCICFDETDRLDLDAEQPQSFVGKFFRRLRSTISTPFLTSFAFSLRGIIETLDSRGLGRGKFIISCLPPIKEKLFQVHPALSRCMEPIKLQEFDRATVMALLDKGLILGAENKTATPEYRELLWEYSDGIPYYVQLICHHGYDADSDGVLDNVDFQNALNRPSGVLNAIHMRFYEDALRRANSSWGKAKDCLIAMAESGGSITLDTLCDKLGAKRNAISTGVSNLRYHGFVAPSDVRSAYSLSHKLCRAWIFKYLLKKEMSLTI